LKNPLLKTKPTYNHKEAYRFIIYKGIGKREVIWNGRDGEVPGVIYSSNGKQQLIRDKFEKEVRSRKHVLKEGELYFANTTKARAKFLAKKVVYGRWHNSRYPLCQQYSSRKGAIYEIYKSFYGNGDSFTILKQGRNKTTYMSKHFRGFISQR
jgi:hypothetical protein